LLANVAWLVLDTMPNPVAGFMLVTINFNSDHEEIPPPRDFLLLGRWTNFSAWGWGRHPPNGG
ncbi:hypothetical protein, partial [Chitinimonas sp. BJB300]|uniref:hypothetical protein n=1 Tax=Chitinimonas sp. BJB300 TaxID=1559339 RepID=UPI001C927625